MEELNSDTRKRTFTLLPMDDVHTGFGCVAGIGAALERYGVCRALLITGSSLAAGPLLPRVMEAAAGRIVGVYSKVRQHVPRQSILDAAAEARRLKADAVVSFGGGSSNDSAKGILLALAENITDRDGFDEKKIEFRYPDYVRIPTMTGKPLPLFAIPTTLSAGEFTHFVGITDEVRKVKDLYIDKQLTAKAVFMDSELTLKTPEWLWLSSGMRAVDHCIEALCSTTAHPFTDALAGQALKMLALSLRQTRDNPTNLAARTQSQIASWMSVAGLANVTLGLSHGIGHQLGARCAVAHGHTSCVMMHHTMRFNRDFTLARQGWIARILGVDTSHMSEHAAADAAATAVLSLTRDLGLPTSLREVGVTPQEFAGIANDALQDLIVATNPRPIASKDEVIALLELAY